jgi:hypothetical protein
MLTRNSPNDIASGSSIEKEKLLRNAKKEEGFPSEDPSTIQPHALL